MDPFERDNLEAKMRDLARNCRCADMPCRACGQIEFITREIDKADAQDEAAKAIAAWIRANDGPGPDTLHHLSEAANAIEKGEWRDKEWKFHKGKL